MHSSRHPSGSNEKRLWVRVALGLLAATLLYNFLEAGASLWAGFHADSIALVGFGFDSVIESAAAGVMLWRMGQEVRGRDEESLERSEERARWFVGVTFFLLAAFVLWEAGSILITAEAPSESPLGIVIAVLSIMIMPVLAFWKLRAADHLGSQALAAEVKETIACMFLSVALLLGLGLNALFGWWWADAAAALLMVPWLVKEGLEGVRGEECGACGG